MRPDGQGKDTEKMPTKRTRRTRNIVKADLRPAERAFLSDDTSHINEQNAWGVLELRRLLNGGKGARELWEQHGKDFLPRFIKENPGRRPYPWWQFDAPELRKRLGGKGTPEAEILNVKPSYSYGISDSWFADLDADIWPKLAKKHKVDPKDPPVFESQATYLKRHGLLSKSELKDLAEKDFAPEILSINADGEIDFDF